MKDTCNTIVDLAREILACEREQKHLPIATDTPRCVNHMQRDIMITAFMRATYCQPIVDKLRAKRQPASKHEMFEIKALIFYTARLLNKTEEAMREELQAALNIGDLTSFSKYEYEILRRYLHERAA